MDAYRIYLQNSDGRLQLGPGFEASDDADALARAQGLGVALRTAELWQRGRLVGRFDAKGVFTPER